MRAADDPAAPLVDLVAGARPNFMKLAPVVRGIAAQRRLRFRIVHTGQHYDPAMSEVFFRELEIPAPGAHLEVGSGSQGAQTALAAAGAGLEHVVKWNIYIVQGQPIQPGFEVFQRIWGRRPNPPTISGMFVAGLANPDFLVEIDAVAVVPLEA